MTSSRIPPCSRARAISAPSADHSEARAASSSGSRIVRVMPPASARSPARSAAPSLSTATSAGQASGAASAAWTRASNAPSRSMTTAATRCSLVGKER